MATAAYSEVLGYLEKFLDLCAARGLEEEAGASRFSLYRSRIQGLSREIGRLRHGEAAAPIFETLARDLPRHLVALFEGLEVGGMMNFLSTYPADVLKPRLKILLSGPEMPSDEDQASNQARNIQFELWLATTLSRAGASVVLAEPDLRCTIGDLSMLVACKRLFSVRKLTKRINEAIQQLHQALRALPGEACSGVVAISLARALPTNERSETIASQQEGMDRLASRVETLVERRAKWRQSREAQAILFQIASTFTNLEADRIQCGYFLTMYGDGPVAAVLNETLQPLAG